MKKRKASILRQINITNSVVITVACTITLFCLFMLNYHMMVENEKQVVKNSMENSIITFDDKLKDMRRVSLACYSNEQIQKILQKHEDYDFIERLKAEQYLREFYTSLVTIRDDISGVYLFDLNHLIYYSDYNISSVNRLYETRAFNEKYQSQSGDKVDLVVNQKIPFIRYPYKSSSEEYFYMIYPVKNFSPNTVIGYIMLSISKQKVLEIINGFMKDSSQFWLVTKDGMVAASSNDSDVGKGESEILPGNIMKDLVPGDFIVDKRVKGDVLLSYAESEYSNLTLVTQTSLKMISSKYLEVIKAGAVLLVVLNTFMILVLYSKLKVKLKPLKNLSDAMGDFNESKIYVRYPVITNDEIGRLTKSFNYMMEVIETLIEKEYKNKEKLQQYEINQQKISMLYLKNQINPHFLYNTLDMIRIKAQLNEDYEVADMTMELVEFYRLNVKADAQIISIEHEIELLKKYMNIMMYRYPQLEFGCELEDGVASLQIPNFLIQPLAENSLLHGLKGVKYRGKISISIKRDRTEIRKILIKVEDNGIGIPDGEMEHLNRKLETITLNTEEKVLNRIGIENIQKRLQVYYPNTGKIRYERNKGGGTIAIITVLDQIENKKMLGAQSLSVYNKTEAVNVSEV